MLGSWNAFFDVLEVKKKKYNFVLTGNEVPFSPRQTLEL